jgi:hypothetical protein
MEMEFDAISHVPRYRTRVAYALLKAAYLLPVTLGAAEVSMHAPERSRYDVITSPDMPQCWHCLVASGTWLPGYTPNTVCLMQLAVPGVHTGGGESAHARPGFAGSAAHGSHTPSAAHAGSNGHGADALFLCAGRTSTLPAPGHLSHSYAFSATPFNLIDLLRPLSLPKGGRFLAVRPIGYAAAARLRTIFMSWHAHPPGRELLQLI